MTRMLTLFPMVCGCLKLSLLSFSNFVTCIVLDPVLKLEYLNATWDEEYLEIGMTHFKSQVEFFDAYYRLYLMCYLVSYLQSKT